MKWHSLTPDQWRSEFAQIYADLAKAGLFEAKRIATHVQPHFSLYPPKFAVYEVIKHPETIAPIMGADDIDPRGQPRDLLNGR